MRLTSDDLASVRLRLQEAEQNFGLKRTVYTGLDRMLQDRVHRTRPKMIRQLQQQLAVQVRPRLSMFIHVHAN